MSKKRNIILIVIFLCVFAAAADAAFAAKDEAERLWELGEKASEAGRHKEALSYFDQSLARCAGNQECAASNLNSIGAVYEAMDDDRKAFTYYEGALAAARKINHRDLIATNLFNTGAVCYRTFHQYDKALSLFEESLRIFQELKDQKSIAIVLFNMGKAFNSTGRYEKALSSFQESLRLNREMKNRQGIAGNMNLIGNVYASLGQLDKPLSYYREALGINRQLNNRQETATSLRNIGDAYSDLLERDKALPYYQEALDIQKRLNLRFDMAITQTNIGAYYAALNQYDKALACYEASLKTARALGSDAEIATNLNNIGNAYAGLGRSEEALSCYRQSLSLDQKLGRPHRIAVTRNNIGMEYFRIGRYEKALEHLNEALRIERRLNNPHSIAYRLNNIGAVYLRQKRYRDAENVFRERMAVGKRISRTRLIHAGLIEVYLETKQYGEALALLKELPPNWRDSRNRRMEYHTQYGLALKGKGALGESAAELSKAVAIVEEIRRAVSERSGFFIGGGYISRVTPYSELMDVLSEEALRGEAPDDRFKPYGRDLASAAFYHAEMTRARVLIEMMAGSVRKYNDPQIPSELKDRESGILRELSAVEKDWDGAFAKGEAVVKRLSEKKERLTKELDALVSSLKKDHPLYAAIHYPAPMAAEDLPLRDNEVLIEFGISKDALDVFVVRKGGVRRIHRKGISREDLTGKVQKFIEPLSSGDRPEFPARLAKELYDTLLSDALKDVKDTERIIIVPDGILGLLPFEALVVKEGGDSLFAGDRWVITYSQSATALALTRLLKPPGAVKSLFAIGNPVYDKADPRYTAYKRGQPPSASKDLKQYSYRGLTVLPKPGAADDAPAWQDVTFAPLPETEDEIRAIAGLFGLKPVPPDILLGVSATESNFRKAPLGEYRYLHFATHADLPGKVQGIKEPFIILGQVENRGSDDGFLTLSEVLGLKFNADMAVLSACSTGRGRMTEGEGVANFARAFQHAGARSVVVSLWEVASDAAVEYMTSFYGHIKSGKSRAEALKLARKEIKAKYPHPFYWSVFVLYGEG